MRLRPACQPLATLLIGFLTIVAIAAKPSMAATFNWTGGGADNSWNTSANWSPAGPPGNGNNTVNINAPGVTIVDNPVSGDDKWRFLNFDAGTIQDHDRANADLIGTWEIGDGLADTATFTRNGTITFRGGTFNVNSDGVVDINGASSDLRMGHVSSNAPAVLNIKGGTVSADRNLRWETRPSFVNLESGTLDIQGDVLFLGADATLTISGGSLSADRFTVSGWGSGENLNVEVVGGAASQIQFRQWNIADNSGGVGTLTYTLEPGEALTPITLTDATDVFGGNASLFRDNFTVVIDGTGIDSDFVSDLVLFDLTDAVDFDDLSQLNFADNLGTYLRGDGDTVEIAVTGGDSLEYLLRFDAMRAGNIDGDLEIYLQQQGLAVPEPSSLVLWGVLAMGLATVNYFRRRMRS